MTAVRLPADRSGGILVRNEDFAAGLDTQEIFS